MNEARCRIRSGARLAALVAAGLGTVVTATDALAVELEDVVNPREDHGGWVSDMANAVETETERALDVVITRLELDTGAEMAVVIIDETDGSGPKEFATALFNYWEIGKEGADNGILVLLVMGERRIEVETGYGVEGILPDGRVGAILDNEVVPHFRDGDIGGGLLAGVRAMADAIRAGPEEAARWAEAAATGDTGSYSGYGASDDSTGTSGWLWSLLFAPLLGMGAWAGWTRRPRKCGRCGKKMRRLREDQEDTYLDQTQIHEEDIKSVDYGVYRCDDCEECTIERSVKWFSGVRTCPQCGARTMMVSNHTVRSPTYTSSGSGRRTEDCSLETCNYHNVTTYTIAQRVRSTSSSSSSSSYSSSSSSFSSSSSSSFGGGSSGGGGAGRSW